MFLNLIKETFSKINFNDNFCSYRYSDKIIKIKNQTFAVSQQFSYELRRINNEDCIMFPALIKGKVLIAEPKEGSDGVYHIFYRRERKRWGMSIVSCKIIFTDIVEKKLIHNTERKDLPLLMGRITTKEGLNELSSRLRGE